MLSFINARNCKGSAEGRPSLSDSGLLLFLLLFQWCLKERHVGMLHQRCMTSVYNTMASLRFWSWWALCTPGTHPTYKWIPNAPTPPMHLPAGFNPLAYWMSAAYLPVPAVVPFTPASVYIYQIEGGGGDMCGVIYFASDYGPTGSGPINQAGFRAILCTATFSKENRIPNLGRKHTFLVWLFYWYSVSLLVYALELSLLLYSYSSTMNRNSLF